MWRVCGWCSRGNNSRNTNAHVTTITNARNQKQTIQYDYGTGKPTLVTDVNGIQTAYAYNDPLDRLTQVQHSPGVYAQTDANQTNYWYAWNDLETDAYQDQNQNGDQALRTQTLYDAFGRLIESRQYESSDSYISTTQSYDALGRLAAATNPSRPGDGLNYATSYAYDALGRSVQVQTPDGASASMSYSADSQHEYTLAADQAGHQKKYANNGLGQLLNVWEDPTGLNYTTSYAYDPLNNLLKVFQGSQTRAFSYDSLAELTSAANPESGTVSYQYDNAGNLNSKTDARGIVTTLSYDELNRVTKKSYSDGTPPVSYAYDSGSIPYGIGQLASVSNANSTTSYLGYDELGRVIGSSQTTNGQTYVFGYTYNRAGALTSETYPSGRTVTTGYDGANRPATVAGVLNGQTTNYLTQAGYYPHGAPNFYGYGNNVWPGWQYNNRLQQSASYATVGNGSNNYLLTLSENWGTTNNNGNLQGVSIGTGNSVPLASLSAWQQTFTYDAVNRLASASDTGGWSRSFSYDQYGNMCVSANAGPVWAEYAKLSKRAQSQPDFWCDQSAVERQL
jgi:YD repeat-containing protein